MEFIRRRIEQQVLGLSGISLGQIDFTSPKGDPGLFGPDSLCWRIHGDFSTMLIGGISALLLQTLHPLALAGVWDHSNFREDLLGRLRRTGQFVAGTTFASRQDAEWLIDRVRGIHLRVVGYAVDGRAYAASDPQLLTWVHVAEVYSFLQAHLRYLNPQLSGAEQDSYYAEIALVAERLGAQEVPRNRAQIASYLKGMQKQLCCDQRSREVLRILRHAPAPSALAAPIGKLFLHGAIDLLPGWAQELLGLHTGGLQRQLIHGAVQCVAPVLRWAVRSGSLHLSRQRMGLPPK